MGENFRELRQKLHEKRHFFNNLKLGIGNWGIKIPGKKSKFWTYCVFIPVCFFTIHSFFIRNLSTTWP